LVALPGASAALSKAWARCPSLDRTVERVWEYRLDTETALGIVTAGPLDAAASMG
jgi:hypothetical protein